MAGPPTSKEDGGASHGAPEKVEVVEKLRAEVENLRRGLITAYSETNGISRLEEQFSLLKQKYDLQIGKLEGENKKLKEILAGQCTSRLESEGCDMITDPDRIRNADIGVNTDTVSENGKLEEVPEKLETATPIGSKVRKELTRSVSLENCRSSHWSRPSLSHSCENVDVATSPIKNSFSQTDKELCSVSVQCKGEFDMYEEGKAEDPQPEVKRRNAFKNFHKLENKENLAMDKKASAKTRPAFVAANQVLNSLKQKKMSEHENQLMVTLRALHSEITVKDRESKKLKNELEALRNQMRRLTGGSAKSKGDVARKCCHVGTQTIGFAPKMQEPYDPTMFQVSRELENENDELKARVAELVNLVGQLKDKRVHDLQILQKLHEEEIDKLASRLNTQTALTNHLHSLLTGR